MLRSDMLVLRRLLLAALLGWSGYVAWHLIDLTRRYLDTRWGEQPRDGSWLIADYPFKVGWTLAIGGVVTFVLAFLWRGARGHAPQLPDAER